MMPSVKEIDKAIKTVHNQIAIASVDNPEHIEKWMQVSSVLRRSLMYGIRDVEEHE